MKKYSVLVIEEAEKDLVEIYQAIAHSDSEFQAKSIIDQIEKLCENLALLPLRGHIPPELERIGISQYWEVHFKPYRIIYQILEKKVFIHCVLDGRRDMQDLLQKRLMNIRPSPYELNMNPRSPHSD